MDDFVDRLLVEERVCEVQLPRITLRKVLEESEGLSRRQSKLSKAMGIEASDDEDAMSVDGDRDRFMSRSPSISGDEDRSDQRHRSRSRSHSGSAAASDGRYISRSPSPPGYVSRSPTRSPEPV